MRRSKLEINLDILKILAQKGPLNITHIMYEASVHCGVARAFIEVLIKQSLIEECSFGRGRIVYSITRQGSTLLEGWKELKQWLPTDENETKGTPLFKNSAPVGHEFE